MSEPLSDAYLQEAEYRARRFSGAYTGTSGTLAADVMRLLAELSRVKGESSGLTNCRLPLQLGHDLHDTAN